MKVLSFIHNYFTEIGEVLVCEFGRMSLSCPAGHGVFIDQAKYGRDQRDTHTCTHTSVTRFRNTIMRRDCASSQSIFKSIAMCHGKRSCSIPVINSVFGNPCGYWKYLRVRYQCLNCM